MAQITQNTPLARVKAGFGTKNDLIDKIKGMATADLWSDRMNADKTWASISNAKLLRLHALLSDAKQRFGTRDKIIDTLVTLAGRAKDADYKKHFASWSVPRLLDAVKSSEKRARAAGEVPAVSAAPKAERPAAKPVVAAAKPAEKAAKPATPAKTKAAAAAKEPAAAKPAAKAKAPAAEAAPAKKPAAKKKPAKSE